MRKKFDLLMAFVLMDLLGNQKSVGVSKKTTATRPELERMLGILNPLKAEGWMAQVDRVRRGGQTIIEIVESQEGGGVLRKAIRLTRVF